MPLLLLEGRTICNAGEHINSKFIFFELCHYCIGSSMRTCHAAGPGSIPGRDKFPVWGFFRGFSSPLRQMSRNFRPRRSPDIIGQHNHKKSFITGANDLRCWSALKHKLVNYSTYRSWAAIVTQLKKYKFGVNMLSSIADCSSFQQQQWHILWYNIPSTTGRSVAVALTALICTRQNFATHLSQNLISLVVPLLQPTSDM